MIYPTVDDVLHVAERTLGEFTLRDAGLLAAAVARPQATAFGKDAYPTLTQKAAALMHSVANDHALVDGNKRLALAATIAFLGLNGRSLALTNDEAYELVMAVADGTLDTVPEIAVRLSTSRRGRPVRRANAPRSSGP